jgi:ubiquinone/menaquinone biosynthesis C-methylase UbiE
MNILKYLADPYIKTDLFLKDKDFLQSSNRVYRINDSIPILIDDSKINEYLRSQIRYFEEDLSNVFTDYDIEEWQKSYVNLFLSNFPDVKGKLVLDCGSGGGYFTIELARRGAFVISCDLTLMNLVKLKEISKKLGLEDNIGFVCCSAEDLPFKDRVFDYSILNAIIEHLPREKDAVQEINRVSKIEAGLMVTVPLSYKYLNPIFFLVNYIHDKRIGHLRRYDESVLIKKFSEFKIKSTYYTGHTSKVLKVLLNILMKRVLFNMSEVEKNDSRHYNKKWFASNIIVFFQRFDIDS